MDRDLIRHPVQVSHGGVSMKKEDRESNWPGKIINFCLINTFIDSGIQILQRYVIQH